MYKKWKHAFHILMDPFNSLTPMSDQDRISPYIISIQYPPDK